MVNKYLSNIFILSLIFFSKNISAAQDIVPKESGDRRILKIEVPHYIKKLAFYDPKINKMTDHIVDISKGGILEIDMPRGDFSSIIIPDLKEQIGSQKYQQILDLERYNNTRALSNKGGWLHSVSNRYILHITKDLKQDIILKEVYNPDIICKANSFKLRRLAGFSLRNQDEPTDGRISSLRTRMIMYIKEENKTNRVIQNALKENSGGLGEELERAITGIYQF